MNELSVLLANVWWLIPIAAFLIFYRWTFRLLGIAAIPEDSIGNQPNMFHAH